MKILGIYDGSGPKYHRIFLPLTLGDYEFSLSHELTEENSKVDIVFFNRLIPGVSLNRILELKEKNGFKLVVDFDDHWILDRSHVLYNMYNGTGASLVMEECIKISDAVFVTHERLYNEVIPINKNCYIFPNAIPKAGQFLFTKQPDKDVRFFWAGGITHKNDLALLKNAVRNISRPGVKFVMGGYMDHPEWKQMASYFTDSGRVNHVLLESLPVNNYYAHYSMCDISLIPLVQNSFNIHKSNLKILEAANSYSPVIVSKTHPYLDFPEDCVNYVDNWYKQMKKLLESKQMRVDQGEKLHEFCEKNYNFRENNIRRKQVFEIVAGA